MSKIYNFLYSKVEYIWWISLAGSILFYLSTPLFVTYHLFVWTVPYFIGRILKRDRWFYSYYIGSALGFGIFRTISFLTYGTYGHFYKLFPSAIAYLFAAFIGTLSGYLYFKSAQNFIRKPIAFVIQFFVYALILLLLRHFLEIY